MKGSIAAIKTKHQGFRNNCFTLLELLVAMSVLIIMAMAMFEIIGRAHQAWSAMRANTRIYENARVAFDLITRDLQSAIGSAETGREIPFYTGTDDTHYQSERIAFVAPVYRTDEPYSKMAEIRYNNYNTGTGTTHSDLRFWLRRSAFFDRSQSGDQNNWNFYGNPGNNNAISGPNTGRNYQRVIPGVENIEFISLDDEGIAIDSEKTLPNQEGMTLPSAVLVNLTLFDPRAMALEGTAQEQMIKRSRRTFTKMIHLKAQGF